MLLICIKLIIFLFKKQKEIFDYIKIDSNFYINI